MVALQVGMRCLVSLGVQSVDTGPFTAATGTSTRRSPWRPPSDSSWREAGVIFRGRMPHTGMLADTMGPLVLMLVQVAAHAQGLGFWLPQRLSIA